MSWTSCHTVVNQRLLFLSTHTLEFKSVSKRKRKPLQKMLSPVWCLQSSIKDIKHMLWQFFSSPWKLQLTWWKRRAPSSELCEKNRRELASEMTRSDKQLHIYEEESKSVEVNYQCKKNKSVCLLSTMHTSTACCDSPKKKPAIINFYNVNKVGVDVLDQMTRQYSTLSASFRWPLAVWANILDISAINTWITYKEATRRLISRRNFILELIKNVGGLSHESEAFSQGLSPSGDNILDFVPLPSS